MKRLFCLIICLLMLSGGALADIYLDTPPMTYAELGFTAADLEAYEGCIVEGETGYWVYLTTATVYYLRYDAAGNLQEYSVWIDNNSNATFNASGELTDMSWWGGEDGLMYIWTQTTGWTGYRKNEDTGLYDAVEEAAAPDIDPEAVDNHMPEAEN